MRALVLAAVAAVLMLTACGGSPGSTTSEERGLVQHDAMGHIHGLDVSGSRLYIATHGGLYVAAGGRPRPVGRSRQDLMGFSAAGPQRFLASGHPALQANQPPHLGLIESRDGGRSWRSVSLLGEADFHTLKVAGRRVYGFDGLENRLLVSSDGGRSWRRRASPFSVIDLAVHPRDNARVVAFTDRGLVGSADAGASWKPLPGERPGLLAWPRADRLFVVGGDGLVSVSENGGRRWRPAGEVRGQPVAFMGRARQLFVALADGAVRRSTDDGKTWTDVLRAGVQG